MTLPTTLPPLPPIEAPEIRQQVFAHATSLTFSGTAANPPQSNERLEFLGDSFLNFCISSILFREFPDLSPGELTALRAGIVSNSNLNIWARAYELQNELVMGYSMVHLQIPEKALKLVADVFEAYIGGVIVASPKEGKQLVEDWLFQLVRPTLDEHRQMLEGSVKVDKMAVSKLYELATKSRKKLEFKFTDSKINGSEERWEAICLWSGEEKAKAKARNQQEAKHRVAGIVLQELKPKQEEEVRKQEQENQPNSSEQPGPQRV
jgi:dsRNA-specific ribonuclease